MIRGTAQATVILLHGGAEHGARYPELVNALKSDGHRVIAPDLRGHGTGSTRPLHVQRFSEWVSDLDSLVSSLDESPVLLGYSLGGVIAASYAIASPRPLRGLVLAAPALGPGKDAPAFVMRTARVFSAIAPRLPLFRMPVASMFSDPAVHTDYLRDPLVHHGWFTARTIGEVLTAMTDVANRAHRIEIPLLILHGVDDVTASPLRSQTLLDRARSDEKQLRLYAGMRHDIFHEPGRKQVFDDLRRWLSAPPELHSL